MAGAEVDSDARQYVPRCHPETRRTLLSHIINWLEGEHDRLWRMLWIMGPAGVGKSAEAQTIAEKLNAEGRLGAALFFSRPNGRDDPKKIITTLAYQLAVRSGQYKRIINQQLAADPTLLEKRLRDQFKLLIISPFRSIMDKDPSTARNPLLVVVDGLDECKSEEAQCS